MILNAGPLTLRHIDEADAPLLVRWLSDPRVLTFYEGRDRPHDLAMVRAAFLDPPASTKTRCIAEHEGTPIGYLQFYPLPAQGLAECGYRAGEAVYGIDLFIGEPERWGHGLGTRLIGAVAAHLCVVHGAQRVVVDPHASNARAIRCYEKAGFRRVKLLPQHELHEGARRDCWLMEYAPQGTPRRAQ